MMSLKSESIRGCIRALSLSLQTVSGGGIIALIHSFFSATIIYWVPNCTRYCARHQG